MRIRMKYLTRNFLILTLLSFISLYLLLWVSADASFQSSFIDPSTSSEVLSSINTQRQTMTVSSIFLNNLSVSITILLPLIGLLMFSGTIFNTGTTLGYLAYATGFTPLTYILAISFPVGVIELFAYSLLMSESILILFYLSNDRAELKNRLLCYSWKTVIFYIILLFIGAVVEVIM